MRTESSKSVVGMELSSCVSHREAAQEALLRVLKRGSQMLLRQSSYCRSESSNIGLTHRRAFLELSPETSLMARLSCSSPTLMRASSDLRKSTSSEIDSRTTRQWRISEMISENCPTSPASSYVRGVSENVAEYRGRPVFGGLVATSRASSMSSDQGSYILDLDADYIVPRVSQMAKSPVATNSCLKKRQTLASLRDVSKTSVTFSCPPRDSCSSPGSDGSRNGSPKQVGPSVRGCLRSFCQRSSQESLTSQF